MPLTLHRRPHLLIVGEVHGQATRSVQNNHLVSPADRAAMLAPMAPAPPVITAIWLVIGGIAASHRGDYKGSMDCSRASTTTVTILAGPLNYAGVNLNINCSVHHLSN